MKLKKKQQNGIRVKVKHKIYAKESKWTWPEFLEWVTNALPALTLRERKKVAVRYFNLALLDKEQRMQTLAVRQNPNQVEHSKAARKAYVTPVTKSVYWKVMWKVKWWSFTCVKPHIDYCLLVWAYCGSEQKKLDYIICRAKQIITNRRCVNIEKSGFKQFCLAKLFDLLVLSLILLVIFLQTCILRILMQTHFY